MSPKLASVAKSAPPPLAFLQNDALDFGRQDCQMCCQPIEQVPLCLVRRRIPDQPALGRLLTKFFKARQHILHLSSRLPLFPDNSAGSEIGKFAAASATLRYRG